MAEDTTTTSIQLAEAKVEAEVEAMAMVNPITTSSPVTLTTTNPARGVDIKPITMANAPHQVFSVGTVKRKFTMRESVTSRRPLKLLIVLKLVIIPM